MFTKISGKYVKFGVLLATVGCVGFLAYLMITWRFGENTTITRYVMPVKPESRPNTHLPGARPTNQGTWTVETATNQTHQTGEIPTSPDTSPANANPGSGDAEHVNDIKTAKSDAHDIETSSTTPQFSADELRRRSLETRQRELLKQIEAMAREGGSIDPMEGLKALELQKEIVRIGEELGTNHFDDGGSFDDFLRVAEIVGEMGRFTATHMTKDGKLPVSKAPELADMLEKLDSEAAQRMRKVIQNAKESGDEFILPKHLEKIQ